MAPIGSGLQIDGKKLEDKSKWLVNAVVALDATTGNLLWRFDEKPWPYSSAAGDFGEDFARRKEEQKTDPRREIMCLPDPQGIPLIAGDGKVYSTSSHNGDMYAIQDLDGDGKISSDEVSTFNTSIGFLNSPALAEGMLVAAPCWGPVYIFGGAATHSFTALVAVALAMLVW